jgi:hypothetical protein
MEEQFYRFLEVGSLELEHVDYIFGIGNIEPLKIFQHDVPIVTFYEQVEEKWVPAIIGNEPITDDYSVTSSDKVTNVLFRGIQIISLYAESTDKCIVSKLDLRPVRLNIFIDRDGGFHIGSQVIKNISFKMMKCVIRLN